MKVLLIQDVDNLGYAGEVKKVANGFGRNYLIPQNLAVVATPGALKQAETIRKAAEKHRAQAMADAQAIANQLVDVELLFERRAGETGKLYGSVTSGDISEAIEEKTDIAIDKRKVALPEPIRSLGEQMVTIKLMIDVSATIKVEVLPLGGVLERERLSAAEQAALDAEVGDVPAEETEPEAASPEPVTAEAEAPAAETPVEEPAAEVEIEAENTEPEAEDTEPEAEDAEPEAEASEEDDEEETEE